MSFREIIWPTRWKVTLSFLIAAVSVFLIYALNPSIRDALFGFDYSLRVASVFMSFGMLTLIYYPLACGVVFLLKAYRKKKRPKRKELAIAAILILVFNPLTFSLFYVAGSYIIYYPCGVEVLGFSDVSPAQLVGMQPGEVITQVDGQAVDSTASLTSELAGKSAGEFVNVKTRTNEYDIQMGENSETHRAVLGIITQTAYCRRW